jgi:hypothetical protein
LVSSINLEIPPLLNQFIKIILVIALAGVLLVRRISFNIRTEERKTNKPINISNAGRDVTVTGRRNLDDGPKILTVVTKTTKERKYVILFSERKTAVFRKFVEYKFRIKRYEYITVIKQLKVNAPKIKLPIKFILFDRITSFE